MSQREATALSTPVEDALIQIRGLNVGYGDNTVLRDIHLDIPRRGVVGVMGPSGTGKSSLLRVLTGVHDSTPTAWAEGSVIFDGREIIGSGVPHLTRDDIALLPQKSRLYTATVIENALADIPGYRSMSKPEQYGLAESMFAPLGLWEIFEPILDEPALSFSLALHKSLLLARLLYRPTACLIADEPLSDIALVEEADLIELLRRASEDRLLVIVLHNKIQARHLCDTICLFTGERLIEVTPAEEFFTHPRTELGREFLLSGSCWPREPLVAVPTQEETTPVEVNVVSEVEQAPQLASESEEQPPVVTEARKRNIPYPRDFYWIIDQRLAGMRRPGLLGDVKQDMESLQALGVRVLVTLTEDPLSPEDLASPGTGFSLTNIHFPIDDMGVPKIADAHQLCQRVSEWIDEDMPTVLHCKAGLGRTGVMLACTLVYRGMDAVKAIDTVRIINSAYIQSEVQFNFVSEFAAYLDR